MKVSTRQQAGRGLDVLLLRDVEERLAAESALRFQARLLQAVGQAVIATDPSGTVLFWNSAAERLYGWSSAEAVGRPIVEMTATQESAEQAAEIMACLASGSSWTGEFAARGRDGSARWVLVTDTPVLDDDGDLIAVLSLSADITEPPQSLRSRALPLNDLPPVAELTDEHGVSRLLAMHRAGASLATITAALNSEGYRRLPGVRWHRSSVARVVAAHASER